MKIFCYNCILKMIHDLTKVHFKIKFLEINSKKTKYRTYLKVKIYWSLYFELIRSIRKRISLLLERSSSVFRSP